MARANQTPRTPAGRYLRLQRAAAGGHASSVSARGGSAIRTTRSPTRRRAAREMPGEPIRRNSSGHQPIVRDEQAGRETGKSQATQVMLRQRVLLHELVDV